MNRLGCVVILLCATAQSTLAAQQQTAVTDIGFWAAKDCRSTSKAAGIYSYVSGAAMQAADAANEAGQTEQLKESYESALLFSRLSANLATTFEAFCKNNPKHDAEASD
ncbi:MAG: hypothetical protein GWP70_01215 [Proteobacteria bacterium]|nr:hypothetical protein [Pseudomonadota bacterium]